MPNPAVKMNPIQAQIVLRHLQQEVKANKNFANALAENPIAVFTQFGFSQKAAAAIVAQEIGLGKAMGITDITTCCATNITTCCVSNKKIFDRAISMKTLPAANNTAAWKQLLGSR